MIEQHAPWDMLASEVELTLNGEPYEVTGLDLWIYQRYAPWMNIESKLYETVRAIDWANPIQVAK